MGRHDLNVIAGSVQRLLRRDAHAHIAKLLGKLRPADISNISMGLGEKEKTAVFSILVEKDRPVAAAVAGIGGNSGTQTLTVIIRGLALGQLNWESGRSILTKEMAVMVSHGLVVGILAGATAFLWKGNYMLGLVLGTAMIVNVPVAGVVGTLIPLTLDKLNVDPAFASGIFVTTCTDAIGFLSFLGSAGLLLHTLVL